jgi:hypothetical protein
MKTKSANIPLRTAASAAAAVLAILFAATTSLQADPPLSGAIFSTNSACTGVDLNIYSNKDAVYIDGGPKNTGAAGLPDGSYCVQVTQPDGVVLGVSAPGAVTVSGGEFAQCYQLSLILNTASSGFTTPGYDDTANPGGEYKVWVSTDCNFVEDSSKTDAFKVVADSGEVVEICVTKYYDANANGTFDPTEHPILGWQYRVFANDNLHLLRYTGETPGCLVVAPDSYDVMESTPVETNWLHTTDIDKFVTVKNDEEADVTFGNVCLGAGKALTLGFWSNKNGQSLETQPGFAVLTNLNLVNADGTPKDFNGTLKQNQDALNVWLLNANATNMAYMLSAQLATMKFNVFYTSAKYGVGVALSALVYAPALLNPAFPPTTGLNALGFITVADLMTAANSILLPPGNVTVAASTLRSYEEALKTALDNANNNLNFVQSAPCGFHFGN